jgi:hypothetical protein
LGAIAGPSLTVSQGTRTIRNGVRVNDTFDSLARLSTLVPSIRSLIALLRYPIVRLGSVIAVLGAAVSILAGIDGLASVSVSHCSLLAAKIPASRDLLRFAAIKSILDGPAAAPPLASLPELAANPFVAAEAVIVATVPRQVHRRRGHRTTDARQR